MISENPRVRFAPSPTGYLHVGGLRTALYNYLFAKKNKDYGTSWRILRIPSLTDQIFIKAQRIRTIQENIEYIGHFHTAGNPGRFDLDDQQEIQYKPIMEVIAKLTEEGKYNGYVAHEFGPKHKFDSLRQAVEVCDV